MKLSDLQWSKKFANSWPSSFRELCSFFNGNKISSNRTIAFRTTTGCAVAAIVSKTWRSIRRWRLKICNFKKHLRHQKILLQKFKGGILELVSRELNHLATILHVYAGVNFYEVKNNILLIFFKKKMEVLLHFLSFL